MKNRQIDMGYQMLAIIAFLAATTRAANIVPVMLWYGESSNPNLVNPLHKTSRPEFETFLTERLSKNQPPMIVFVKDNFCIEDIKHHTESLQQLNDAGALSYFTSVESALSVFENLPSYNVTLKDNIDSIAEAHLALTQANDLNIVPEIYNTLRESSPNLIVGLTGKSCAYSSLERTKRAIKSEPTQGLRIQKDGILFFSGYPRIQINNSAEYNLSAPVSVNAVVNQNPQKLIMNFENLKIPNITKITLIAYFKYIKGYTTLDNLGLKINDNDEGYLLKSRDDIYFPPKFSYHCSLNSIFSYKNKPEHISVKISNLQVQTNATVFGDAYDCIGFMSIPIWTGIFVTAILALIMIWGLIMIMDIRTMDRFDDPKGKTITISAQE